MIFPDMKGVRLTEQDRRGAPFVLICYAMGSRVSA